MIRKLQIILALLFAPALAFAQGAVAPRMFVPFKGGGGSVSSGSAISGCTAYSLVYIDSSGNLACALAPVNGSVTTAGRSIFSVLDTISGSSTTSNFLNITGTFPATLSAETSAIRLSITGDNDAQTQNGIKSVFTSAAATSLTAPSSSIYGELAGSTGGRAGWFVNSSTSAGTNEYSVVSAYTGSGSSTQGTGILAYATNGGTYAGIGGIFSGANASRAWGVLGYGDGTATAAAGGYFAFGTFTPTSSSPNISGKAALIADNSSVAANIFEARDNGAAVFTIADGGAVTTTAGISNTGGYIAATGNGIYVNNVGSAIIDLNGGGTLGGLFGSSASTPDAAVAYVGTTANAWHIEEYGDKAFDFNNGRCGTSACTDPALIVHSHNQQTNEYVQLSNDGTLAHLDGQATTNGQGQFAFAGVKTLTESSATVVVDIPVASGAYTGATINWTVVASDATDHSSRRGSTYLAVINKAGTETCNVGDVGTTVFATSGAATLSVTTGQDTTGTNVCTFTINAVSSLAQTVLRAHYSVIMDGPGIPAAR